LRNLHFFFTLALASLLAGSAASAKTRRAAGTKQAVSSKHVASNKGKAGKARGKQVAAARRAPRQSEPTSDRYRVIQQALVDKGHHPGPVTGQWGPEWVAALKDFQAAQKLNADGKLGALSLIALGLGPKREPLTEVAGKPEPIE
jgi:peptidoglycan hydrolase-like protein with peptidoglycan-binding domain